MKTSKGRHSEDVLQTKALQRHTSKGHFEVWMAYRGFGHVGFVTRMDGGRAGGAVKLWWSTSRTWCEGGKGFDDFNSKPSHYKSTLVQRSLNGSETATEVSQTLRQVLRGSVEKKPKKLTHCRASNKV
ncbi:hypothetical protein GUJ93_ZPchr0013g34750 [Zizania palustris]|uniref:Uncharacterized protein n=1 Tax=Zizania palustris TaxID=103762 RepID=A0A8J6C2A3_ZIZPA|nr:hypothetical protein GUJ93_ZPchr0013g34750 [Zizania palustris]